MAIDYKDIIDNLNDDKVKQLLDSLGIPYKETQEFLLMPTYCHHDMSEDASWKLYYYKDSHFFMCYSECQGMSIFKFLKNFYEAQGYTDYDWYTDIYLVVLNCSSSFTQGNFQKNKRTVLNEKYQKRETPQLTIYPSGVLDIFTKFYAPEWLDDGITKETMDKFNILYSISRNKIIIPHYDINNNLVGIRGRALNEWEIENIGKYAPVSIEDTIYKHPLSLNLYGLNITKNNIKNNKICFIAEGEKSVLQADSFNRDNCVVASCGSNLNIYQVKLLMSTVHPQEIILCYDQEEKNRNCDKYFNKLYNICKKYNKYCNFSFIYDRENLLNLKESPFDKGEEIFEELIKRRVKVK